VPENGKFKILVIDDDEALLDVLTARLTHEGYEVITALNGQEGLNKAHSENPDILLVDVIMPVLDGFEFVKKIQEHKILKKLPIIIMSGRAAMKDTFDILGADLFITKPLKSEDLVSSIKLLLTKKVLLVSESHHVIDTVTSGFKKCDYETHVVNSEKEMYNKCRKMRYSIIVAHLPYITNDPKNFVQNLNALEKTQPTLLVFCDSEVKNTEDGNTITIKELSNQWERTGIARFYDRRITAEPFSEIAKSLVTK
jgi:DNA-binding response OmpR family regulator